MKVLLVNGSPNEKGCTHRALKEVEETLKIEGIDSNIFWIGNKPISGCIACYKCIELKKCVFNDTVNQVAEMAHDYDGFIFGAPVHYAALNGAMTSFLDRVFYSDALSGKNNFYLKPGAGIISARRAGTTAAFDQINKYFTISQMPVVSSRYWNMVHGTNPEEVSKDEEGLQAMRFLARNMAWMLKTIKAGKDAGIQPPTQEKVIFTNFIR